MLRIILASQSPRRRQLLEQIGLEHFEVLAADADETYDPSLPPEKIVASISRQKAEAVRPLAEGALIITADTMVFMDGLRLGKPSLHHALRPLGADPPRLYRSHRLSGFPGDHGGGDNRRHLPSPHRLGDRQLCAHR